MCFRQALNCQNVESRFCEITEKEHAESLSSDHDLTLLSLARVYACKGDDSSLQTLKLEADGAVHNVLLAMELKKAGKLNDANEVLYDLLQKTEEGTVVHHEALRLLALWSDKQEDLRTWASEWLAKSKVDQFDTAELGIIYRKRLNEFKEFDLVQQITSRMDSEKSNARMPASQERERQ
jgi:hypothetical protein